MTTASTDGPPSDDEVGPVLALPERVVLDPLSAATLAINEALDPMLAKTDAMVMIDVAALARAALDAVADMPTVPPWEGPRRVGGARRDEGPPEPELTVDVSGAAVMLGATVAGPTGDVTGAAQAAPADARAWALAVLAACTEAGASGPYVLPDPFAVEPLD